MEAAAGGHGIGQEEIDTQSKQGAHFPTEIQREPKKEKAACQPEQDGKETPHPELLTREAIGKRGQPFHDLRLNLGL